MSFVVLLPVLFSFLLLAAHFLFHGSYLFVGLSLLFPLVLLVRRRWVPWVVQIALLLGAFEWLATLMMLIEVRDQEGRPWKAAAIILGSVLIFTAGSGLVFATARLRRRFGGASNRSAEADPTA